MTAFDRFLSSFGIRSVLLSVVTATACAAAWASDNEQSTRQHDTNTAVASCRAIAASNTPTWPGAGAARLQPDSIVVSPYKNPRGQSGQRFAGKLDDGTDVVWTSIQSDDALLAMQITTARLNQPDAFWHLNQDCTPTQQRRIVYDDNLKATELLIIDPADGSVQTVEALNPDIPSNTNVEKDNMPVRVGLVDSGVNYLLPEISQRLARDNNGKSIGFDFWENDAKPFDVHFSASAFHVIRHGTGTASLLLQEAPFVELVPYRYPQPDLSRMQTLIEHAALHQVSIIGLPLGGNKADQWQAFYTAAQQHPDILFIASAGNNGRNIDQYPVYPAALDLANLLVVTSADDFAMPAEGVNWGRATVDYMLPAEQRTTVNFFGEKVKVSGSSYAVPRAMALAARWKRDNPHWHAREIIAEFARRYADGSSAKYVGGGYIADPLAEDDAKVELVGVQTLNRDKPAADENDAHSFNLPLSVFVLDEGWSIEQVNDSIVQAESILSQCKIRFNSVTISQLSMPDYLKDLATGPARTLISELHNDSEFKPIKVFFARDTKMANPTDGAAFGRGNTRRRPWLQDSVWLMEQIEDTGVALAHELFHVLSNSGAHIRTENNLMQGRTSPANIKIESMQCEAAVTQAKSNHLLFD